MKLLPVWILQLWQVRNQEVLNEPLTGEEDGWVPEGAVSLPITICVKNGKGYALVANLSGKVLRVVKAVKTEEIKVKEVMGCEVGSNISDLQIKIC